MIPLSALAFNLRRDHEHPLFVQLCDQLRARIVSGKLTARQRLPASRQLAAELGLARGTVVTAYEQLVAEGYLESRRGSGFFVGDIQARGLTPVVENSASPRGPSVKSTTDTALLFPGYPDARLFPARQWARCLARTARVEPEAMVTGQSRFGDPRLRAAVARYLADWRGLAVDPAQVMITAGSVDALEICLRSLAHPGQRIALENPGYQPLRHISENLGMQVEWLRVGPEGTDLPTSQAGSRLAILTPSQQFPLGGAMPIQRRLEFLQWARSRSTWIVEDDYDSEFRYAGRPIPALASLDQAQRTIYIGTFSKVFSVGLRIGYLIMPPGQIDAFAETLARFGVKAARPCQRALANFIDDGDFYRHVRRVRRVYGDRRGLLLELLHEKLSRWLSFDDHQAGMQICTRLVADLDDGDVARRARQSGMIIPRLSSYYGAQPVEQGLLLGFCPYREDEIRTAVAQLVRVVESVCDTRGKRA